MTPDHRPHRPAARARAQRDSARYAGIAAWRRRRSFSATQFPLERLLEAKRESIAVVLPGREVAGTIASIARRIGSLRDAGLIDEAVLVDANSADGTAEVAAGEGLTVVQEDELAPERGPSQGKGDAMWRALAHVDCEIVAYLDSDTEDFEGSFVTGLLGPLLCEPEVQFVKGCFERPFRDGETVYPREGGRVTELMARPLLNLYAPELSVFDQPLAGEVAARRELLEQLPFCVGYGVEVAMLIDAWRLVGLDGLAQVDLGRRQNRHQSLRALSAMSYSVLVAASRRLLPGGVVDGQGQGTMVLPPPGAGAEVELRRIPVEERPPLAGGRGERRQAL